jgi:hypothetical protein
MAVQRDWAFGLMLSADLFICGPSHQKKALSLLKFLPWEVVPAGNPRREGQQTRRHLDESVVTYAILVAGSCLVLNSRPV